MNIPPVNEPLLRQYLLDQLTEAEREAIEREYLADENALDQLLSVEDDLLDDYVRGDLNKTERERFESVLLATPKQRAKLRQTKHLLKSIETHARLQPLNARSAMPPRFSLFKMRMPTFATACALMLLLAGSVWLVVRDRRLAADLQRLQVERTQAEQQQRDLQARLEADQKEKAELLDRLQDRPPPEASERSQTAPTVAIFVLPFNLTRGGPATSFTIKHDVETVHLQIPLGIGTYKSYQAELQTADGVSLYKFTKISARRAANGSSLLLTIPAKLLKGRDYVLQVSGVTDLGQLEAAGFYSFRIIRE